ncbi:MAG: hypothetical protein MJK14_16410 [Rivularia sp. ALOHA_DT_140]|nr:hypothetical protein [Rivularia sp. ALOHA_DT_140]
MKRNSSKSSEKISYIFVRLSTWTGYIVGLLAIFLFALNKHTEGVNLISVAHLFFEAAQINVELEESIKKNVEEGRTDNSEEDSDRS